MEVAVTTGAIRLAKCHGVTINKPRPSFFSPNQQCQSTEGKTKMHMQVIDCIYVISGNNKFVLRHNVTGAPA